MAIPWNLFPGNIVSIKQHKSDSNMEVLLTTTYKFIFKRSQMMMLMQTKTGKQNKLILTTGT